MTPIDESFDVVIAGGGIVGLSLGVALARAGMQVAVLEKTPMQMQLEHQFDGRVSAIAAGSKTILDTIGVWPHIASCAEPIRNIRVSDGDTPFFLDFDHKEVGDAPFGYIVENRHTRYALQKAASLHPNLHIFDNAVISSFTHEPELVKVMLADGRICSTTLLVGADGKQSSVRTYAGIKAIECPYEQTAIVCTIEHTLPHNGLAQERFLPAGPFAVLPMTPSENGWFRSSLVWVEPHDRVDIYMELSDEECAQEITERVGDYLGEIRLTGPRFTYALSLMHAKTYVAERCALIGDAAHGIHPIAGQGVNLGFRDVAVLSEVMIQRFAQGKDIGSAEVLAHYQRLRRFDNISMIAATDGLNRLFGNRLMPVRLARGLGLWAVSHMPAMKRIFMKNAMGLSAVPRKQH
jgi:2-octaprenyl-6-methoxyphenol hydroxylase